MRSPQNLTSAPTFHLIAFSHVKSGFPAYSLGWVLTEEPYFPRNEVLSFLKIRGSYGTVGNDKIGGDRFLYLPSVYTYTGSNSYYFGEVGSSYVGYVGSNESKAGNPTNTQETTRNVCPGQNSQYRYILRLLRPNNGCRNCT